MSPQAKDRFDWIKNQSVSIIMGIISIVVIIYHGAEGFNEVKINVANIIKTQDAQNVKIDKVVTDQSSIHQRLDTLSFKLNIMQWELENIKKGK